MTFSLLASAALASALLIGLIPTLVDGIKKPLRDRLALSESRLEWLNRLFYFTWLPAMPLAGLLLDSWYNKGVLFFGLVALIIGIAWLALARSYRMLALNAIFLGIAYSCVTTAAVRLMTTAFFPDDKQYLIAALNLGFIPVGLGALLGPWVVLGLERVWGYRQGLLYLSVLLIIPAAITALCDREHFPQPSDNAVTWDAIVTHPHMLLIGGIILVYFAMENCLEFWPENYLREIGYQERGVQWGMLVFWLGFIGMRAVMAWWPFPHPSHETLTLALLILSAMALGNLVGGYEIGSGSLGFWLVGACYGPLLPGFLGIALGMFDKPLPASALGVLLALSGLDTLLMRPAMNAFGHGRPARTVMRVPMVLALIVAAPLLYLAFIRG